MRSHTCKTSTYHCYKVARYSSFGARSSGPIRQAQVWSGMVKSTLPQYKIRSVWCIRALIHILPLLSLLQGHSSGPNFRASKNSHICHAAYFNTVFELISRESFSPEIVEQNVALRRRLAAWHFPRRDFWKRFVMCCLRRHICLAFCWARFLLLSRGSSCAFLTTHTLFGANCAAVQGPAA